MTILLALLHLLLIPVTFAVYFWLPGALLLLRLARPLAPYPFLALSAGLGGALISQIYFGVGGLSGMPLNWWFMLIVLGVWLFLFRKQIPQLAQWFREAPWHAVSLAEKIAGGVTLLFFLGGVWVFNEFFRLHTACDYNMVWNALGIALGGENGGVNSALINYSHTREGFPGMLAPVAAVLGPLGIRVYWGLMVSLLFAVTVVMLRLVTSKPWMALAGALILTGNREVWDALDLNVAALLAGSLTISLLFLRSTSPVLIGLAYGAFWNTRHVGILCLPALLGVLVWGQKQGWLKVLRPFGLAWFLVALPALVRHAVMFGNPFINEHFTYINLPHEYHFFGFRFTSQMFLNWPFHSGLVRSFGQPYPNFLLEPLYFIRHYGVLVTGLILAGFALLLIEKRWKLGLFALAWFVPGALMMSWQENWTQFEKLYVIMFTWPGLFLAFGYALDRLASKADWWKAAALSAGGAVLTAAAHYAMISVRAPLDQRQVAFWSRVGDVHEEDPLLLEWYRKDWQPLSLLPQAAVPQVLSSGATWRRILHHLETFRFAERVSNPVEQLMAVMHPGVMTEKLRWFYPVPPPGTGDLVRVYIDVSQKYPDFAAKTQLRAGEAGPTEMTFLHDAVGRYPVVVPWNEGPVEVSRVYSPQADLDVLILRCYTAIRCAGYEDEELPAPRYIGFRRNPSAKMMIIVSFPGELHDGYVFIVDFAADPPGIVYNPS